MTPGDLLNLKRGTAEVQQRGARTRGYQEIHVTGLNRFPRERPNRTPAHHPSRAGTRPRESAPEPPEGTPDPAAVPAAADRAPSVLSRYTCSWCPRPRHRTPGQTTRGASCQASQLAAAPVVQARILVASQASSQSGPSGRTPGHARPARQLLHVTRCGPAVRTSPRRHRYTNRSTARRPRVSKPLVGRVGLEPTTGGL
jgi:hypothetical protein